MTYSMTQRTLGLAFALASLTAVGCSQEDYYCDMPGTEGASCYYCDGVGCRRIDPPARSSCECAYECAASTSCTSLGCTATCDDTSDCQRGTVCSGGYCLHPSEVVPSAQTCECSVSADCPSQDLECVDGECRPGITPRCEGDDDCEGADVCVAGECRAPDTTCRFNSQCGLGRVCINQQCVEACSADNPCPTGFSCSAGFCVEQIVSCGDPGQSCADGLTCIDGVCVHACDADSDCAEGYYCAVDRCRVDDRPRPTCDATRMCVGGAVCVDGTCRSPCSTPTDCQRFDVQLTQCIDMLCYTTNEATSDCASAAECMSGQSCIDGVCRSS